MYRQELDILKGILIICVVIGHTQGVDIPHIDVFWFHMPAFFLVSGLVNKNWNIDKNSFIKRFFRQCVPYFVYCLVIWGLFHIEPLAKFLMRIAYGGSMNTTTFTYPFWFINALFITQIMYGLIRCKALINNEIGSLCGGG